MRTGAGGGDRKMMSPALATGWLQISAAESFANRARLTAMARVPTRSVRISMAPRCSDPSDNRRSRHTRLPQSDIKGWGEPPV